MFTQKKGRLITLDTKDRRERRDLQTFQLFSRFLYTSPVCSVLLTRVCRAETRPPVPVDEGVRSPAFRGVEGPYKRKSRL